VWRVSCVMQGGGPHATLRLASSPTVPPRHRPSPRSRPLHTTPRPLARSSRHQLTTHTQCTHPLHSSRTLSTQACSSQTGHATQPYSHCLFLTDRPCYTACSSQAHVHTAQRHTQHSITHTPLCRQPRLPLSFHSPLLSTRHQTEPNSKPIN
jgi:hypothetical protein